MRTTSKLLLSNFIARLGDGAGEVLFAALAYRVSNQDASIVGIIYGFRFLPYLFLGPLSARIVDTYEPRILLSIIEVVRGALACSFALLLFATEPSYVFLAIYGILLTVLKTIFNPGYQTAIYMYAVDKGDLPRLNSTTQFGTEIGMTLGPIIGGILIAFNHHIGLIALMNSVTYLLSAAILIQTSEKRCLDRVEKDSTNKTDILSIYSQYYSSMYLDWRSEGLFAAMLSGALIIFVGGFMSVVLPGIALSWIGDESSIAWAMSFVGIGAISGSLAGRSLPRKIDLRFLLWIWIAYGLCITAFGFSAGKASFVPLAMCFLLGFSGAVLDVAIPTVIHMRSTEDVISRNFATFSMFANVGDSISGFLVSIIAAFVMLTNIPWILGTTIVSIALLLLIMLPLLKIGYDAGSANER
jgi:MFS family permease